MTNWMGKIMGKLGLSGHKAIDYNQLAQQREHQALRAERDQERLLLRLSRAEYVDTMIRGVVSEIRGEG